MKRLEFLRRLVALPAAATMWRELELERQVTGEGTGGPAGVLSIPEMDNPQWTPYPRWAHTRTYTREELIERFGVEKA